MKQNLLWAFRKFLWSATLKALLLPHQSTQKLENMEPTNIIPATVIIDNELRDADHVLRRSLREAQAAYAELRELQDLGEIPQPNLCTADWLEKVIAAKREAIKKVDFLTEAQKSSQLMHFGKLHKKPYIGDDLRPIEPEDIRRSHRLMFAATGEMLVLALVFMLLIHFL